MSRPKFFYLGSSNSVLKPAFSNVCGLPFKAKILQPWPTDLHFETGISERVWPPHELEYQSNIRRNQSSIILHTHNGPSSFTLAHQTWKLELRLFYTDRQIDRCVMCVCVALQCKCKLGDSTYIVQANCCGAETIVGWDFPWLGLRLDTMRSCSWLNRRRRRRRQPCKQLYSTALLHSFQPRRQLGIQPWHWNWRISSCTMINAISTYLNSLWWHMSRSNFTTSRWCWWKQ